MSELYDIPIFSFSGNAVTMGYAEGECFRQPLKELIEKRLDHTCHYKKVRLKQLKEQLLKRVQSNWTLLQKYDSHAFQKTKAIVQAAKVDLEEYLISASVTDFRDKALDPEGCTSVVFNTSKFGMMGTQTWDLAEENMPYVIMIYEKPDNGVERWTLNCYGFPPLMGMNVHGLSIGTTNLKTRDIGIGLGYVQLIDHALNYKSARSAVEQFKNLPRLASHTYWIVDTQEGFQLDTGHEFFQSLSWHDEALVKTNHPTPNFLQKKQLAHPSLSSLMRKKQAELLFQREPNDIDEIKKHLADRSHGIESISRLSKDGTGITTNACFIAEPRQKRIWACRGPAQLGIWKPFNFEETYDKKESA